MVSPPRFPIVLARCCDAVESAPDGDLPWFWRIRLWDAFNREYPADSLLRRKILAFIVAGGTLPAFEDVRDRIPKRMQKHPRCFLQDTQRLILGEISEPQTEVSHFVDDIECAMALYELGNGVYSVIATHAALPTEVERREHIYKEYEYARAWEPGYRLTEADDEWTCWETHYWAAIVAGGSPGTERLNVEKHRDFWRCWLLESIPSVCGPMPSVIALLHSRPGGRH